jgi:prepilin-type N-terminal cleavage/methylation domain-containing protein
MNFLKNSKGFTLIELMIVIAICGILCAIVLGRVQDNSSTQVPTHNKAVKERQVDYQNENLLEVK